MMSFQGLNTDFYNNKRDSIVVKKWEWKCKNTETDIAW